MKFGKLSISLVLVLIIGLAAFNLYNSGGSDGEPLKGADELSALPDERLEEVGRSEIGRGTYREGAPPEAWRKLNEKARHLWSVAAISGIDPVIGLPDWLSSIKNGATAPGPEDMRDGLAALGLDEAKLVMEEILTQRDSTDKAALGKLHARLIKAMNEKTAQKTRQTWVRDHLHDLLKR